MKGNPHSIVLGLFNFMQGHLELSSGTPTGKTAITLEFKTRLET